MGAPCSCSFKTCSCFLLILIFLTFTTSLFFIFFLKPQKPVFTLQTITVDYYKLHVHSNSTLFISSLLSLTLNAQNPNKVALRFSASRLYLYHERLPLLGVIQVPAFYQPAQSNDTSLLTRVLFRCVDVTRVIAGGSIQDRSSKKVVQMKMLGDIRVHVLFYHLTLPTIKVALDCDIIFDYTQFFTLINKLQNQAVYGRRLDDHTASSFADYSRFLSKNCTLALHI